MTAANTLLLTLVLGTVAVALIVDLAALVAWLRSRWR
jgi:Flp pilus assembly pilin Flp